MTTFGEVWMSLIEKAEGELKKAEKAAYPNGDLVQSMIHIRQLTTYIDDMQDLLLNVSKTAFERVMNEKAR